MGIVEKMDYTIRSVSFRAEEEEAHIYFSARDSGRTISIEGYIPVPMTKFEENSSISKMIDLVKSELLGRQVGEE